MDSTPPPFRSSCLSEVSDDMRDFAAPCHLECAVEQLSESQPSCAQLQPPMHFDSRSQELSLHSEQEGFLVRIMGSVRNLGLFYMAVSAFNLAMMGVFAKLAGKAGMSTWEIVAARSLIVTTVCLFQLTRSRTKPWGNRIVMLNFRGVLGMVSVTSLFFAVQYLPVADAVVFTFLAPLIILVASPYVLAEDTGNQWLPIFLATVGVLLICQPSFLFGKARLSYIGVIFGITHATISAAAKMLIRALKEEHTAVKMLYLSMYCLVVSGSVMAVDRSQWTFPDLTQAALLLACGLSGLGVQFFLTLSLERVEASLGMGMTYTAIIWSELVGVTLFREIPNAWAIVGTVVVLYSTLHSGFMQLMSRQAHAAQPVSPRSPGSDVDESILLLKAQP